MLPLATVENYIRSMPADLPEPALGYSKAQEEENLDRVAEAVNYNAWLLERAAPYLGRRVLDFGAGLGTFTQLLAERAERVVAVEPDAAYLERLCDRFARDERVVVVARLEEVGAGEQFDSIVCFNVLEHIEDDRTVVAELQMHLAPEGHLLLLLPAHPFLFGPNDSAVGHHRRYRRSDVRRLLGTELRLVEISYVNPIGALGWLTAGRVLRRSGIPYGPLRVYDKLVPVFRRLDALHLPFGLSLWAVARPAPHA
jgi:SAM-dependent methyltransferase